MRRSLCAVLVLFLAVISLGGSLGAAAAHVLTLAEPVELRAGRGPKHPIIATAPAGAELVVMHRGRKWAPVSFEGRRLYAPETQLVGATPSDAPSPDPSCDYGYPYSGSGQFFARPLAQLRHGEPLGFLFGYHRFYPC